MPEHLLGRTKVDIFTMEFSRRCTPEKKSPR